MNNNRSIDLLVVSTACHTAINRQVYSDIKNSGYSVVLIVPKEMKFSCEVVEADNNSKQDVFIEFLDLIGSNARTNYFPKIYGIIKKYNPATIVVDNDPASFMSFQISLIAKIAFKSKMFCISCENLPLTLYSSYSRRGIKGVFPLMYKKCILFFTKKMVDGVFVINDEGDEIFKSEGFRAVQKIPLGFDSDYFKIDKKSRKEIRGSLNIENKFVIGYFGRIVYEKGVHLLISALSELLEYDWVLLIDKFDRYQNDYSSEIAQNINNNIANRVIYVSPSHSDIGKFMNAVDVVVMPSIKTPVWVEQYGRVAPEAMACGKLVIASNSGAIPMLINNNGLLFEEGNVSDLVAKLKKLFISRTDDLEYHDILKISNYAHSKLSSKKQAEIMISTMYGAARVDVDK